MTPTLRSSAHAVAPAVALLFALVPVLGGCTVGENGGDTREPFEVAERSVAALQDALASGAVTSVQLVDAYLARIAAYDDAGPELNALLHLNPNALAEAEALDRERARSVPRGPLHGIPVLIKDNYDTADMPTTGGSIALAEHRPTQDASVVRRLRESGAIILGKTNLHELAYGITTISSAGGQTRNPYDPARNPGGSSGGTAAGVAASFAALGWGSDTCGSIRIPAAVNNLFGLRPTKGLTSIDGIMPLSHSQDVVGPLARTMEDLAIGLDVTIGPDPADPATAVLAGRALPRFTELATSNALAGASIGVLTNYFGGEAPEEEATNAVIRSALPVLTSAGATVRDVEFPGLGDLLGGTSLIDLEFKWDLMEYLARTPSAPVRSLTDIVQRELFHPAVENVLRRSDRHESRDPDAFAQVAARREALSRALLAFMDSEGLDALLYPSIRRVAAPIGEPALGNNCQLSASTGFPALALPAGFTAAGLPVGMELLGRPFADERLVAIGFHYERVAQPRRAPPSTPPLTAGDAAP